MRRTSLVTQLAAIVVLALLSLAACGSDDSASGDDPSDTPTTAASSTTDASEEPPAETESETETEAPAEGISKADFVEQANAICAEGNAAIEAAGGEVDPNDPDSITAYVSGELIPNIREQLDAIRALGFPAGDEVLIGGTLDAADGVLDQVEANPELITDDTLFTSINSALNAYGLTDCGAS